MRHLLVGQPLAARVVRTEVPLPEQVLASYVGRYELNPRFAIAVTLDDGKLCAQATGQPRFRIFASAPDRFFFKVVDAQLEFERDPAGAVSRMTLVQNGMRQVARRLPDTGPK